MKNKAMKLMTCGVCAAVLAMSAMAVQAEETELTAAETELETEVYTGDASNENVRNQDDIGEKELLVISFGTSFNDNRRETIGAIEDALEAAFPDFSVRRGFTSNIIIDHVMSRDNVKIDDVGEALDRAVDNGVKTLVVQPTHLMNGFEYTDLSDELAEYADAFDQIVLGEPLLTSDEDFEAVADAIVAATCSWDTAPRQSPIRSMRRCRMCSRRAVMRITSSARWRRLRLWTTLWPRLARRNTRRSCLSRSW